MSILYNEQTKSFECYTPDQVPAVDKPFVNIDKNFIPEHLQADLLNGNPHKVHASLLTTAKLLKRYIDITHEGKLTVSIQYEKYLDPKIQGLYEDFFEDISQMNDLTMAQVIQLYKDGLLPDPPKSVQFFRNDGVVFEFKRLSMQAIKKAFSS